MTRCLDTSGLYGLFLFLREGIVCFIIFWLNTEESVLFCLRLFLLSIENKLKGKNKMSSYPKGLLWNYSVYPPKINSEDLPLLCILSVISW